jgi:uncharacterized membrane protein
LNDKLKKVIVWRILSILFSWLIAYFYLGSATKSLELTVVLGISMTIIHYFFEGWWDKKLEVKNENR